MSEKLRVVAVICGTRRLFADRKQMDRVQRTLPLVERLVAEFEQTYNAVVVQVVSGCSGDADLAGELYAIRNRLVLMPFRPDWDRLGKQAGYLRNVEMAKYAQAHEGADAGAVLALWDGESRGTNHMISLAALHDLHLLVHTITPEVAP